jgi:hypothetical protein
MAKKEKTSFKVTKNGIKISGPEVEIETDGSLARNALEAGILIADSMSGETRKAETEPEKKEKKVVVAGRNDEDST